MSFTSNFNEHGLHFDSDKNWDDTTSVHSDIPVEMGLDMLMTPRRSARVLQARLDEPVKVATDSTRNPSVRIRMTRKVAAAAAAAASVTGASDTPGKVLRSGTVYYPSPAHVQKQKGRWKDDSNLSVAGHSAAAASSNPYESTIVGQSLVVDSVLADGDDDGKMPSVAEEGQKMPAITEDDTKIPAITQDNDDNSSSSGDTDKQQDDYEPPSPGEEDEGASTEEINEEENQGASTEEINGKDQAASKKESKAPKQRKGRKNKTEQTRDRYIYDLTKPWSNGKKEFFPDDEVEEQIWFLAKQEFEGTPSNRLRWKKEKPTPREGNTQTRCVHKCHYKNESGCRFSILVLEDHNTKLTSIYIGNRPHSDHTINKKKRGPSSKVIAAIASSPNTLRKRGSKSLVNSVMFEKKMSLDKDQQRKAARAVARLQRELDKEILGGLDGGTYEGLDRKLRSYTRELLELQDDFDENTYFLCGSHVCDGTEGNQRIAALFSSGNSLMNIYRFQCTGYDLSFSIDTSYRYTVQGYGLLPIKVVDLSQTGHTVAYGLVNKEDTMAHNFLLYQLKKECERTIEHYRVSGYFD